MGMGAFSDAPRCPSMTYTPRPHRLALSQGCREVKWFPWAPVPMTLFFSLEVSLMPASGGKRPGPGWRGPDRLLWCGGERVCPFLFPPVHPTLSTSRSTQGAERPGSHGAGTRPLEELVSVSAKLVPGVTASQGHGWLCSERRVDTNRVQAWDGGLAAGPGLCGGDGETGAPPWPPTRLRHTLISNRLGIYPGGSAPLVAGHTLPTPLLPPPPHGSPDPHEPGPP